MTLAGRRRPLARSTRTPCWWWAREVAARRGGGGNGDRKRRSQDVCGRQRWEEREVEECDEPTAQRARTTAHAPRQAEYSMAVEGSDLDQHVQPACHLADMSAAPPSRAACSTLRESPPVCSQNGRARRHLAQATRRSAASQTREGNRLRRRPPEREERRAHIESVLESPSSAVSGGRPSLASGCPDAAKAPSRARHFGATDGPARRGPEEDCQRESPLRVSPTKMQGPCERRSKGGRAQTSTTSETFSNWSALRCQSRPFKTRWHGGKRFYS